MKFYFQLIDNQLFSSIVFSMKKIYALSVFYLWILNLAGQSLYQHPYLDYLGSGLEMQKIVLGPGLPYDGAAKRFLLENLPATWIAGFNRMGVPTSNFVDAFGCLTPRYQYFDGNHSHKIKVLTDRFGNLEGNLFNRHALRYGWNIYQNLHLQRRRFTDLNDNNLADFEPGRRILWNPSVSWRRHHFETTLYAYYLGLQDWGGEKAFRTDPDNHFGHSADARYLQLNLAGGYFLGSRNGHQIQWLADYKRHRQDRELPVSASYRARERMAGGKLEYSGRFAVSQINAGVHYSKEQLQEELDSFSHQPEDRFWRWYARYSTALGTKMVLKSYANIDKRPGKDWTFLPAAQLDILLHKKSQSTLSLTGSAGKRLARPLAYHLNWMALSQGLDYDVQPFEKARQAGMAFSIHTRNQRFLSKLTLDRTRYEGKALVSNREDLLAFRSSGEPLKRTALEWLGYVRLNDDNTWDLHLIGRREWFSGQEVIPFFAAWSAQFRTRFRQRWLTAQLHYTVKSPQNPAVFDLPDTPVYHRLDLSAQVSFSEIKKVPDWLESIDLGLFLDHAVPFQSRENGVQETGILLYPSTGRFPWEEGLTSNLRLQVGWAISQ